MRTLPPDAVANYGLAPAQGSARHQACKAIHQPRLGAFTDGAE
jgi:hypothetical protein